MKPKAKPKANPKQKSHIVNTITVNIPSRRARSTPQTKLPIQRYGGLIPQPQFQSNHVINRLLDHLERKKEEKKEEKKDEPVALREQPRIVIEPDLNFHNRDHFNHGESDDEEKLQPPGEYVNFPENTYRFGNTGRGLEMFLNPRGQVQFWNSATERIVPNRQSGLSGTRIRQIRNQYGV